MGEIVAWKCEDCGRWVPAKYPPTTVLVDDLLTGDIAMSGGAVTRIRGPRRMVVCNVCANEMRGGPSWREV